MHSLAVRRPRLVAAVLVALLATPLFLQHVVFRGRTRWLVDLDVYRSAGESLLTGRPVYEHLTAAPQNLPFTYPPVAAVFAVPLTVLPFGAVGVLWTLATIALLTVLVARLWRPALARYGDRWPYALAVLTAATLYVLPLRDHVKFAQVNLILVALVVLDLTAVRPRWPRGALVGLAVALKLTPGVFVVYLWLTGRRRAALTAAASAAGFTLLAFAVSPQTSVDFWAGALLEPDRLGRNEGTSNQSLRGMLLRTPLPPGAGTAVWLVLVAVVAAVGFRRAVLAQRSGDELTGIALTGLLAVLLSPVAWIHHLVWLVVLLPAVGRDLSDPRRVRAVKGIVAFFVVATPWFAYRRLLAGTPPELLWRLLQNAFGLAALALLVLLPVSSGPPPRATPPPAGRTALPRSGAPAPAAPPAAGSVPRPPPASPR